MECLKKIKIEDTIYIADTDFRTAIECNRIAEDENIDGFERALAIIYTMFGEKGLKNPEHYERLLKWIQKYLLCGNELKEIKGQPDMDYIEDMNYIEASFMSDYHIDLQNTQMDWQKFNTLINGLSNSELGNCCVLNRVRNLRNYNTKEIKDLKERHKIEEAKKQVALKKYKKKKEASARQKQSAAEFFKAINIGKE